MNQYRLVPADKMRAQAAKWGADTRVEIYYAGNWPLGLPFFDGKLENTHGERKKSIEEARAAYRAAQDIVKTI